MLTACDDAKPAFARDAAATGWKNLSCVACDGSMRCADCDGLAARLAHRAVFNRRVLQCEK
jgi:hypothetical protein